MNRELVVSVARELFWEKGFHGTSMRDIAVRLESSPAAIYNDFMPKNEILIVVLERPIQLLTAQVESALEGETEPLARLIAAYRLHILFHLETPMDAEILFAEGRRLPDEVRGPFRRMQREYEQLFISLLRDAAEVNEVRNGDFTVMMNVLLSAPASATRWFKRDGRMGVQQMANFMLDMALIGLRPAASEFTSEPAFTTPGVAS